MQRLVSAFDGDRRQAPVKGRELALVMRSQRKQIGVGDLASGRQASAVDAVASEQADVIGPEVTGRMGKKASDQLGCDRWSARPFRVAMMPQDSRRAVLRQRSACPLLPGVCREPLVREIVKIMIRIDQRDQYIDVEKKNHSSSSRSRLTSCRVIGSSGALSRTSNGIPLRIFGRWCERARPLRARSETTCPIVRCSRSAIAFAASAISSSRAKVVRMIST